MERKRPDQADPRTLIERDLTARVLKAFYKTYNVLGYGFLESVYKNALFLELSSMGFRVQREVPATVFYFEQPVGLYKIDLLVEEKLALELKATEKLSLHDKRQPLNFLNASKVDVALLLHYGPEPKFYRYVHSKHLG
jgi:GxxExxY protein